MRRPPPCSRISSSTFSPPSSFSRGTGDDGPAKQNAAPGLESKLGSVSYVMAAPTARQPPDAGAANRSGKMSEKAGARQPLSPRTQLYHFGFGFVFAGH